MKIIHYNTVNTIILSTTYFVFHVNNTINYIQFRSNNFLDIYLIYAYNIVFTNEHD